MRNSPAKLDQNVVADLYTGLLAHFSRLELCEDPTTGEEWVRAAAPRGDGHLDLPFDIISSAPELAAARLGSSPSIDLIAGGAPRPWVGISPRKRANLEMLYFRAALRQFRDDRRAANRIVQTVPDWSPRHHGAKVREDLVTKMHDDILARGGPLGAGLNDGYVELFLTDHHGWRTPIPIDTRPGSLLARGLSYVLGKLVEWWASDLVLGAESDRALFGEREALLNAAVACRRVAWNVTLMDTALYPIDVALANIPTTVPVTSAESESVP
jgi:hypothetical protein